MPQGKRRKNTVLYRKILPRSRKEVAKNDGKFRGLKQGERDI
jgi:hypothetical protein